MSVSLCPGSPSINCSLEICFSLSCVSSLVVNCFLNSYYSMQDVDDFFEHERTFLVEYHNRVKDSSIKSDKMTRSHKSKLFSLSGSTAKLKYFKETQFLLL